MASLAKPPCDEAVILTGVPNPALANKQSLVLAAAILGSSMAFIDGTVVNLALPAIQVALQATLSQAQWVIESYALLLSALMLAGGSLGDLYGERRMFASGVVLFAVGSAWCGVSPNIGQLIGARALQGIGGAPSGTRKPCLAQCVIPGRRTRPRDRDLVRFHVHHDGCGPRTRRVAGATWILALGFLHQSSGRGSGAADRSTYS
jgi:MFS family permease